MNQKIQPSVLRWAGSKRKLLPALSSSVPNQFNRYIEPFAGSAALFFYLQPEKAVLSDLNSHLINAWQQIKSNPTAIHKAVTSYPGTAEHYYKMRKVNINSLSPFEQAVTFVYLNRYCFNGVYRTNKHGEFNVPYGSKTGIVPSEQRFLDAAKILRRAKLLECDYEVALAEAEPGDFVYLDPPYYSEKNRGEYGPGAFDSASLPKLVDSLKLLTSKDIKFLLSYKQCAVLDRLCMSNWKTETIKVKRSVAGFCEKRLEADEVLVRNY